MGNLSARERRLLALLAVVAVAGLLFLAVQGLVSYRADLARRLEVAQRGLAHVQLLVAEEERVARGGRQAPLGRPLQGLLEDFATQLQVQDRLQMAALPQAAGSTVQSVDMKLDRLTLDETVSLVYMIENADIPLVLDQVELSPSFKDKDLLRLSLRVLAQG